MNPQPLDDYLHTETTENRILGSLPLEQFPTIHHVGRFGVIHKRNQPNNKRRLILDCSSPGNHSVSDGVDPNLYSLSYPSVDDAAKRMLALGPRSLMAKEDIARAYRNVPVNPDDRALLGMSWHGHLFIDTTLPLG